MHKVCRPIFYRLITMQTKYQSDEYTLHVCMVYVFIVMHCGVLKYQITFRSRIPSEKYLLPN